jgi:hypothetical protein
MACHLQLLNEENANESFFSFFSTHCMCSLSQHLCYIKKKNVLMVEIFDILPFDNLPFDFFPIGVFPFGLSTAQHTPYIYFNNT